MLIQEKEHWMLEAQLVKAKFDKEQKVDKSVQSLKIPFFL